MTRLLAVTEQASLAEVLTAVTQVFQMKQHTAQKAQLQSMLFQPSQEIRS